jgi:hypothetical protein
MMTTKFPAELDYKAIAKGDYMHVSYYMVPDNSDENAALEFVRSHEAKVTKVGPRGINVTVTYILEGEAVDVEPFSHTGFGLRSEEGYDRLILHHPTEQSIASLNHQRVLVQLNEVVFDDLPTEILEKVVATLKDADAL